jgi:hypothetical protein
MMRRSQRHQTKEEVMSRIVIEQGIICSFSDEELEALAGTIQSRLYDYDVEIDWYQNDSDISFSLGPLWMEAIATNVPWEALTGAAATVLLESIRDWLARLHSKRKARYEAELAEAEKAKRSTSRVSLFKKKEPIVTHTPRPPVDVPQEVSIYGPSGQILGVVFQESGGSVPAITVGDAVTQYKKRREQMIREQ